MKVQIGDATLYQGNCLDVMSAWPPRCIDAVVTDPPYGIQNIVGSYGRYVLLLAERWKWGMGPPSENDLVELPVSAMCAEQHVDWSAHPINWPEGRWSRVRQSVLQRDEYTCQYCGAQNEVMDVDHVMPKSRGGRNTADNLVAACRPCNASKGARTPEEWRGE